MGQNSIFREIYLLKTEAGKYWVGLLASSKCQITCTRLLANAICGIIIQKTKTKTKTKTIFFFKVPNNLHPSLGFL